MPIETTASPSDFLTPSQRPQLKILLAAPRGFCAGVDRAIAIVELALKKFGPPVYVRHEIVHNKFVVDTLKSKGAVFVKELHEIPPTDQPVIFSAHGVAKSVPEDANRRNLFALDATCPLVFKVHAQAKRDYAKGYEIILIGHAGHPEVVGTMGQLPEGAVKLVETLDDVAALEPDNTEMLAMITQTTLSVDDTAEMAQALKKRFPSIRIPKNEDICYATTNRQGAVKEMAPEADCLLVVGAPHSSNSMRLVDVAKQAGCERAFLVQRATEIDWADLEGVRTLALTAGASAPEILVEEVIDKLKTRFDVSIDLVTTAVEGVTFSVPKELRDMERSEVAMGA
ncbi:MAG: 4-hydroxy-3-methylbut-2-enyl diphosphate reductase [Pseudomonadota bacterium]